MDLIGQGKLGFQALLFNRNAIKEISEKSKGWTVTFLIAIVAGITTLISMLLNIAIGGSIPSIPGFEGAAAGFNIGILIGNIVFAPIGLIIGTGLIHVPAKIFGGKGNAMNMYKNFGSMYILQLISWIPVIGILASIWHLIASVVVVSEVHQLSIIKSILAVLAIIILFAIIGFIALGSLFAASFAAF